LQRAGYRIKDDTHVLKDWRHTQPGSGAKGMRLKIRRFSVKGYPYFTTFLSASTLLPAVRIKSPCPTRYDLSATEARFSPAKSAVEPGQAFSPKGRNGIGKSDGREFAHRWKQELSAEEVFPLDDSEISQF
jgi:hypothetical protein